MAPHSPDHRLELSLPTPEPAATPQWTTPVMDRFACAQHACEDTCCRDWGIEIDRPSLDRLRAVMGRTAEGRDKLVRLVVIGRPSPHAGGAAHIQLDANGACPMLDEQKLCGVHATYGEEALSTACSVFPRTALQVEDRIEVGGSLGCPEVARLVLFADEGALALAPADRPMLPRDYVGRAVPAADSGLAAAAFPAVRAAMTRLFREPGHPLSSRFVFAAALADRLDAVLADDGGETSDARRPFALRRVGAEVDAALAPETLAALHRDLGALAAPGEATLAFVATILLGRKRLPHARRYGDLLDAAFGSLQAAALGRPASAEDAVTPGQLWAVYQARRSALAERLGAQVEAVFANWATHYLQRHPTSDAATLVAYLERMGLHLLALRLLLAGHPALAARLEAAPDARLDREALATAAVHVVQTYTKSVVHSVEYQETIARAVADSGGATFGRLVVLAKTL